MNKIHRKSLLKNSRFSLFALTIATALVLSACGASDDDSIIGEEETPIVEVSSAGSVFAMSNILEGNTIVLYTRADDGTLSLVGEFGTEGSGGDFDGP